MARRPPVSLSLDPETSSFVVEGYNWARPFSNFLPGIAGKWGVPLWVYWVSRAQAVSSVGVRNKDGQILEFQSFNQACFRVAQEGFRTFLKLDAGAAYEPFLKTDDVGVRQTLTLTAAELTIRERHRRLGLDIEVTYYGLPSSPVAALVREVRIRSTAKRRRRLQWIDGVPRVLPYGLDQATIKGLPRHIEAMMGVVDRRGVPLFRLKQTPEDREQVGEITGGNFYVAGDPKLGVVVDPEAVFGEELAYGTPWTFDAGGVQAVLDAPQHRENTTPCAFTIREDELEPDGEVRAVSLLGFVRRDEDLDGLVRSLGRGNFLDSKRAENGAIIEEVADRAFTVSAKPELDAYAGYDFLDNVIRGGMPLVFETAGEPSAFYLYSRQNGDLERDYHYFVLDPTYLSQGTGHYRSVLQNRRNDVWFFPEVGDANIRTFLNLIQLDGYNPLEVLGLSYRIADQTAARRWLLRVAVDPGERASLLEWMRTGFTPGELVMRLEGMMRRPRSGWEPIVREVLAFSRENEVGSLHEGFWVDHWHYNFDLLDAFAVVYPDRLEHLLMGSKSYTYFDDPDVIVPRRDKIVDAGGNVRQYGAVVRDPEKARRIAARDVDAYVVRTKHGQGEIYRTSLLVKLLTIVVNRLATLDPAGTGVEMEAGKPGWNDSMNGLPGLLGSGLSETLELRRAVRFLLDFLERDDGEATVDIYLELVQLIRALKRAIRRRNRNRGKDAAFRYWDSATTLKENYREATRLGVAGDELTVPLAEIRDFLLDGKVLLDRIFTGSRRRHVLSPDGVPYTYFVNEVEKHRRTRRQNHEGQPLVEPTEFGQRPVKLFLEGPVHWLKDRPREAKAIYDAVRRSPIYDHKLGMYKSSESMEGESPELGRAVGAYPRGWIENESIYLHMEYKYLLEILRSGLCEEFWRDAQTALVPFMDPEIYGRSTLEGASFIVSSAYADARHHGRAFQPRLSGITTELLHMWIIAVEGTEPFRLSRAGALELALAPRLPGWLFTERASRRRYRDFVDGWQDIRVPKNAFAFKLLNRALVVYDNPLRRPTYGDAGVRPVEYVIEYRDGRRESFEGATVSSPHSEAVREGQIRRLDVRLG
jgi:hypothetical protein